MTRNGFSAAGLILLAPLWALAQNSAVSSGAKDGLTIVALEGEGAANNIKTKFATAPVIEVRDVNQRPVAGAEVTFALPNSGPGGVFAGHGETYKTRTNTEGQATTPRLLPNDESGRFNIRVTAQQGSRTGSRIITQSNSTHPVQLAQKKKSGKLGIILAVVAAGGVGGILAATHGGGGSSGSTAAAAAVLTITPGPVTVGGPR